MAKKRKKRATKSKTKKSIEKRGLKKPSPYIYEKKKSEKEKPEKQVKKLVQEQHSMVIYVGQAQGAKRTGKITGKEYIFTKNSSGVPISTKVDNKDLSALLEERGRGCWRVPSEYLFQVAL